MTNKSLNNHRFWQYPCRACYNKVDYSNFIIKKYNQNGMVNVKRIYYHEKKSSFVVKSIYHGVKGNRGHFASWLISLIGCIFRLSGFS